LHRFRRLKPNLVARGYWSPRALSGRRQRAAATERTLGRGRRRSSHRHEHAVMETLCAFPLALPEPCFPSGKGCHSWHPARDALSVAGFFQRTLPSQFTRSHADAGIRVMLQISSSTPHGVFEHNRARRPWPFQANRDLILARGVHSAIRTSECSTRSLSGFHAIQAQCRIKPIAPFTTYVTTRRTSELFQAAADFDGCFRINFHADVLRSATHGGRSINSATAIFESWSSVKCGPGAHLPPHRGDSRYCAQVPL